ncbi:DNA primase [Georgenia sp. 10Sc9-8]|uniref:DNA primase n=1 Tax=Georgenia halotolerans TaxID=3028317 RepID=A0ABT5U4Z5_9MICO|nr:DNA primase [Georgenia halotolerans]
MATDPRAALDRLIAAAEAHLAAVASAQDEDAPAVLDAGDAFMDAFDTYDEALFERYGVGTPFEIDIDDDEYEDDDESDED